MRRSFASVALVSLVLAACGGSPDESAPVETAAPTATPGATLEPPTPTEPDPGTTAPPAGSTAPTSEAPVEQPAPTPAPSTEPAEPAKPELVWPDDGCSADNSPTPVASADGPVPAVEVRPASADGPLPDLAVRRINCKGGWENLRNELPSEQPLLVWFWAPH